MAGQKNTHFIREKKPTANVSVLLAQDGKHDDDKVKDVPRLLEVVLPQREDLEDALARKDDYESHVEVVECKVPHFALVVVVEGHGEHVERDEQHDDHVELLVGHDAEYDGLGLPLKHA
jgi:hypothetical protein